MNSLHTSMIHSAMVHNHMDTFKVKMDNVGKLSDLLAKSWRSFVATGNVQSYKNGLTLTRKIADAITLSALKQHDSLLACNMSWYNPINKRAPVNVESATGKIIGIVVNTKISPGDVYASKIGAGSEIAVVEMAQELANLGHSVYVFCNIDYTVEWKYCIAGRNPQFLPMDKPDHFSAFIAPASPGFYRCLSDLLLREPGDYALDHLIVWRTYHIEYVNFNNYAPKLTYWSHDVAMPGTRFDFTPHRIFTLTNYHTEQLKKTFGDDYEYVVGCNGTMVDTSMPIVPRTKETHFNVCYASNYVRGLGELLSIWPGIFKTVPQAKLFIYYGRQTWGLMNEAEMAELVKKITALKPFGVTEMCVEGALPHKELLKEFEKMSVFCYPYIGESETFSIVSAAAQQLGVITAVRKRHGLVETCSAQPCDLLENNEIRDYVVKILQTPEEELMELREKHKSATLKYTWAEAARVMAE